MKDEKPKLLYERLKEYADSDFYPFHMPGHKRKLYPFNESYSIDITEIDGFDDFHHPEGVLRDAMDHTAAIWGRCLILFGQWIHRGNFKCYFCCC